MTYLGVFCAYQQKRNAPVALSYAQQADFNLQGALASLKEAVELGPENALAWSRLSELWLSFGDLDKALEAAKKTVVLNPNIARTQTVLGFSYLTQIKIRDAKNAFEKAIELDQAAPLPRLGLGLAKIRHGDLKEGREEIEIAASLDPDNSLIRSYLGKAYYEEKRDKLAKNQFAMAKELDPKDPTAWFYDAILKQSQNRPVEALEDLQKSIELNDNRAVYRSRLMLDEDLAARSASLGRIYNDLGFQQLALAEGWKSVNTDPANYSAHRFLADSYAALPRHQIARVSELLQSQLLQPINITPVQPSLAESKLFILEGTGPSDPSFNEFNPLFECNRLALQASGVAGGNSILGDELVQSGLWGRYSYSIGQFHYETDGFRENNDQDRDIYNVFTQVSLTPKTSLQGEFRSTDIDKGDMQLTFLDLTNPDIRQKDKIDTLRFGVHHAFTPRSDILSSFIYQHAHPDTVVIPDLFELSSSKDNYVGEVRYLFRPTGFNLTAGIGHRHIEETLKGNYWGTPLEEELDTDFTNVYAYSQIDFPKNVSLTVGGSADFFDGVNEDEDRDQFNPKFGIMWNPVRSTILRGAIFRTLTRPFISQESIDPTLEPTQVAGFNQFFFGVEGEEAWHYGIAVDQKFTRDLYAGAEFFIRDLETVSFDISNEVIHPDWDERIGRAYLYWVPCHSLALSAEYLYEWFERDSPGIEYFLKLRTHRVPLGLRYFNPNGLSACLKVTYVNEKGIFGDLEENQHGKDDFWVVDASIGYRLPKRYGLLSLDVKNLFDEDFQFQDTDPGRPQIMPERLLLVKLTLSF